MQLGRHLVLRRDDEHGVVGIALGQQASSSCSAAGLRQPPVLGLEDDPPVRRAWQASIATTTSPFLPVGLALSPTASGVVARGQRDRVERGGHRLLVGAALRGALLALGGDLLELLLLGPQARELARAADERPVHLAQVGVLLSDAVLIECSAPALEAGQRVLPVRGGELAQQILARLGHDLGRATARTRCWTAALQSSEKCRSSALVRWPLSGAEDASRPCPGARSATRCACSVKLASTDRARPLELGLDEIGLAPVCSRSRTRAPISMASATGGRVLARLARSRDEPDGALVADDEAVDAQAVAQDADAGVRSGVAASMGRVARYPRVLTEPLQEIV